MCRRKTTRILRVALRVFARRGCRAEGPPVKQKRNSQSNSKRNSKSNSKRNSKSKSNSQSQSQKCQCDRTSLPPEPP